MVKHDLAKLVVEFRDAVVAETAAARAGDVASANKHTKRYVRVFERLRQIGDEGREALVPLMSRAHRPDVRATAAAFLLRFRHAEARAVLRELARGEGMIPFEAGEALKRWDEGAWQLDPE